MDQRISGSFPGGPRRSAPVPDRNGPPRLARVEDIESRLARARLKHGRRRRRRRVVAGFGVVLVFAGGIGVFAGMRGNSTRDELTAEQEAEQARNTDISSEVNRALLELWRMEDVEAFRNNNRR